MKRNYKRAELELICFADDAVRTSDGTDEGMGAGKDYFAIDDFDILSSDI